MTSILARTLAPPCARACASSLRRRSTSPLRDSIVSCDMFEGVRVRNECHCPLPSAAHRTTTEARLTTKDHQPQSAVLRAKPFWRRCRYLDYFTVSYSFIGNIRWPARARFGDLSGFFRMLLLRTPQQPLEISFMVFNLFI